MEVQPVRKKSIYEEIVTQLRGMIDRGELKPGDKLPPERKLAELFSVSRGTVREAIRALSEQHLVESRQGAGTYVTDMDAERFATVFAGAILRGQPGLRDIFEVRKLLEPRIAALAARNRSSVHVRRMEAVLAAQSSALTAGKSGEGLDQQLHGLLAEASGNKILLALIESLHDELSESRVEGLQSPSRQQASLAAHRAVVSAVRNSQEDSAHDEMRKHLEEIERIVFGDKQ